MPDNFKKQKGICVRNNAFILNMKAVLLQKYRKKNLFQEHRHLKISPLWRQNTGSYRKRSMPCFRDQEVLKRAMGPKIFVRRN